MGKGPVSMLSERLHHVNEVMSPTCTKYSSGVSVSCFVPDPNHTLFYLLSGTPLCGCTDCGPDLAGKCGHWENCLQQQEESRGKSVGCFLAWDKVCLSHGLLKGEKQGLATSFCKSCEFILPHLWEKRKVLSEGSGLGRAENNCYLLARKPSPGICPVFEVIK